MMDEATKTELLERFREYLEGLDAAELPEAEDAGDAPDLYSLFIELAALRNEVKLESRQVKQALEHSRELIDALQETNRRQSADLGERRRAEDALQEDAERDLLLEVLELRDRLDASLGTLNGFRPGGFLERPRGRTEQLIRGMGEGLEISLRRVDALLARYRVQPVAAVGGRLDPQLMRAAALGQDSNQDDGIVLSEIRKGYRRGDKRLRLAEVVVNKREQTP